ncbi:autotransporter domain-containing protein [Novosphingobium profundi]|uniref:autotransporter outer membrane beta-barrel domain-containing protein n=1 Tax=Novosphingobium profundi TaxID=1774954 RepID=UPI001BD963BC|nr:autotransporter domain-containing protein [Novosphingobium profundi]MBT0668391.1 autotransporter domain-containing protein [Novosphingobium profundi]
MSRPRWISCGLAAAAPGCLAALALPSGARAQDAAQAPVETPSEQASKELATTADTAAPDDTNADAGASTKVPLWSLAVSGGVSTRDDGPDGTWQSLALSRRIGRGYVRASAMRYNGTLIQANTALPSNYYIATISAGGNFDNWVTDGWVSYGRQDYGRITTESGSRESTGSTSSPYFAIGGDFGRVVPLASDWYLTPTVATSYAHGKLLRTAPQDSGLTDLETSEPTVTASATIRLDHAFGASNNHYVGLLASRHWSSNGLSQVRVDELDGDTPVSLRSVHRPDGWFEMGATGSMEVLPRLNLDLYATRSFGVVAGDTTAGGLSLRVAF